MKKIFYLAVLSLAFLSCDEDDITLRPHNAVGEDLVLKNINDFENAVRGAYVYMYRRGGEFGYGGEFLIDTEVMTDNLIYSPQGRGTNLDGFRWTSTASSPHFDYFESAYRSSDMASKIIMNLGVLPADQQRNNVEGEARFIRALSHFDLVRSYSKIPSQGGDALQSLGMTYLTAPDVPGNPTRPTVADTYQQILDDLLKAKDLINADNGVANGRASKSAVYALLSRVYLYMGDYQNVLNYGQLAIDNASGAMGTIASGATFVNLWNDANVNGVLFKLRIQDIDLIIPGTVYLQGSASARKSEYVVSKEFFSLFSTTDIRKTAYTATSNFAGKAYNHVIKYDGRTSGTANVVDIKVLRIEEVYLNMAEAQYKLNGGGLNYLDVVRSKRYTPFVSGGETGTALWSAIMLERRLELAFEMDRFFTLKRLNLPMDRSATDGHFADGTGVPATTTHIDAGDFRWQMPIPQYIRDINPDFQQNPQY